MLSCFLHHNTFPACFVHTPVTGQQKAHTSAAHLEQRSEQVCLASSDLLHMHLALAGTRFPNCHHTLNIKLFYCYQMSGIGKYPFLALDRAQLSFGSVLVGEEVEQTVQLFNQGLVPADFTVAQALRGPDALTDTSIKVLPAR